jgi:hypothetical protein
MPVESIRLKAKVRFFSVVSAAVAGEKHTCQKQSVSPVANARTICARSLGKNGRSAAIIGEHPPQTHALGQSAHRQRSGHRAQRHGAGHQPQLPLVESEIQQQETIEKHVHGEAEVVAQSGDEKCPKSAAQSAKGRSPAAPQH